MNSWRRKRLAQTAQSHRERSLTVKRYGAGYHLVHDQTKRIYVRCGRKVAIFELLGAHIGRRAKELVYTNGTDCGIYITVQPESQSKVRYHYPDTVRVFGWHKKYVSRFEVSVENSE